MEPTCLKLWSDNAIVSSVISVLIGVILANVFERVRSNGRRKAHWSAIATEVHSCKKTAQQYVDGNVVAPLYRMPLIAFGNGFGELVADGAMTGGEFRDLSRFYSWVEDINRGLDLATMARYQEMPDRLLYQEHERLKDKTRKLVADYFPPADKVVREHCRKFPDVE